MTDYQNFPPVKLFLRALKNAPKSALLYQQIWEKGIEKGQEVRIITYKKFVRKEYLISPTMFRNLLAPLMFMNLIHFIESDDKFQIDVLGSLNAIE
jgi:hypothetical protein